MQHRIIEDRIFRVVAVEAADVHAATVHISTEKPLSDQEQREYRDCVEGQ